MSADARPAADARTRHDGGSPRRSTGSSSAPAPLLVVADFDGTLAAGSRDPAAARIEPGRPTGAAPAGRRSRPRGRAALHVAILTGRTVADVAARARVGGIEYLGDHGLQSAWLDRGRSAAPSPPSSSPGSRPTASRPRRSPRVSPTSSAGRRGCSSSARAPRSRSTSARRTTSRRPARRSSRPSPRSRRGSASATTACGPIAAGPWWTCGPSDAGGKREAVERLIERHRPGAVVSLGDDLSDADAFDAVLAARDAGRTRRARRSRSTVALGRAAGGARRARTWSSGRRATSAGSWRRSRAGSRVRRRTPDRRPAVRPR